MSPKSYALASRGHINRLEKPFLRYLPRSGRILEAGCGLGRYVLALRTLGYEVEGVEWSADTVQAVRSLYPDLPIYTGDVAHLEVHEGYYSAYISLGVVEHRRDGPEPFLQEAYRVLQPGGVALISVPYFHSLRRLKARLGLYREQPDGLDFYQYAFTQAEFAAYLQAAGFKVITWFPYGSFKGIKDEAPPLAWIARQRNVGWRLEKLFRAWAWLEKNWGHMILAVCQK
ncbi:MAG: class I SAM-dependent methyltransferase [Anaerolineales bacterium]|nr:class I SAM-dependent methyltransferase [Anaerolineales bacterium]